MRDLDHLWIGHPTTHILSDGAKFYYENQFSFYISSLLFLYNDARVKHKDRNIITTHHFITIALVAFSLYFKYHRAGSYIFLIHDCSDIFLEMTKTLHYANLDFVAYFSFTSFILAFLIGRIILFPRLLYSTIFRSLVVAPQINIWHYRLCCSLLIPLQIMNIIWFGMILNMLRKGIQRGQINKDYRSDSDEEPSKKLR